MRHHADLLDVEFWQQNKERIQGGEVIDFFPYGAHRRFGVCGDAHGATEAAVPVELDTGTPADQTGDLAPATTYESSE